MFSIDI